MAWNAPMTAIAGAVFTAAQFNTYVRDNFAQTAPAKATIPGAHFAVSDTNEITQRVPESASVLTSGETTTSTTFDDLATGGPAVTVDTGPFALVAVSGAMENNGAGSVRMSYEVSGDSAIAPADNRGIGQFGTAGHNMLAAGVAFHTDLTPGTNTFTCKYRVSAGTGTYASRRILVVPF